MKNKSKDRINKILILLIACIISLFFLLKNLDNFKCIYKRLSDMVDIKNLDYFFNLKGESSQVDIDIKTWFDKFKFKYMDIFGTWSSVWYHLKELLYYLIIVIIDIFQVLSILLSFYFLIKIILFIFFYRKNKKYNYTFFSKAYWKISFVQIKVLLKIKDKIKNYYLSYKKYLLIAFVMILSFNSFIPRLIVEILICLEYYIYCLIENKMLIYFYGILKYFIFHLPKILKSLNLIELVVFGYIFFLTIAIISGYNSLDRMHQRKKDFVRLYTGQTTIINGAPGTGKTVNIVDMCLMAEELYIDELESNIFNFELNHPSLNLALFRLDNAIEEGKISFDRLSKKIRKMLIGFRREILNKDDYGDLVESYDKLNNRDGYIVSNFSIKDPYFNGDFSHKLFMETLRMYKKQKNMSFESYMVIGITEADKEWNSHDDKGDVADEGVAASFGLISQATDRKVKIFCDYQNKDQLIKRIRANSETYIVLRKLNFKCTRLIKIAKKPLDILSRIVFKGLKYYEGRKYRVAVNTSRKGLFKYKRNDYTLGYAILRKFGFILNKLDNYFSRFYYMEHIGEIANNDDMKDAKEFKTFTCIRDLSYKKEKIFDSCMFGQVYDDLKEIIKSDKYLRDIPHWQSATPSLKEYLDIDMRFYNKIFNAQMDNEKKDDKKKSYGKIEL